MTIRVGRILISIASNIFLLPPQLSMSALPELLAMRILFVMQHLQELTPSLQLNLDKRKSPQVWTTPPVNLHLQYPVSLSTILIEAVY